jgi:hypothetical protein
MTEANPVIPVERRRYAALIDALKLARYALLRTGRRFDCPPHDRYTVAHTIDVAIADAARADREVRS